MTLMIGEIIEKIKPLKKDEAIEFLKKHMTPHLMTILRESTTPENYDKEVLNTTWKINKEEIGWTDISLYQETKNLKHFYKTSPMLMPKRKKLLADILEELDRVEAGILCSIIGGTFYNQVPNLTPNDIKELILAPK
jgi:hypothetical protein